MAKPPFPPKAPGKSGAKAPAPGKPAFGKKPAKPGMPGKTPMPFNKGGKVKAC